MPPYRVLVVDDSAFMRKFITDLIAEDSRFTVVAAVRNGREAVESVMRLRPDAVTLDVEMPEMNGLEALDAIMRDHPTPVIMLSTLTKQGASQTMRALEIGAFDFVQKPSGSISLDLHLVKEDLLEKLHAAAASGSAAARRTVLPQRAMRADAGKPPDKTVARRPGGMGEPTARRGLVAIGTSTGGPKALQLVLTQLPSDYPFPIAIVQHMPPGFTKSLAQRLDSLCEIQVREAEDGMRLEPGTAYIAPGGRHMKVVREMERLTIRLSGEPLRNGHRPSVDVLFESIAPLAEFERTAVIMTGMGSDGARAMKLLRDSGVTNTIAEDQSTCVVYGMPRAAVEMGCAKAVVPLDRIPDRLLKAANDFEEV
ncbi:protein-glutamate methylesterase/protein-glutamine glutaminase [Paenibacillus alkalitolerans]|uniref:protein-glutamate methylesterase/protein-glutamine glutaminase n=1 Tax=Paenibacillus alkalitolerans TaxID=2799335 RepID=UPI0018F73739|nr:chemotaxis response regulator protein-glutamate methylesterase [Paenibacillus alkalitolerans]